MYGDIVQKRYQFKAEADRQKGLEEHQRTLELRKMEMEFEERKMRAQHAHQERMAALMHGTNQGSNLTQPHPTTHFTASPFNESLFPTQNNSSFSNSYDGLFDHEQ